LIHVPRNVSLLGMLHIKMGIDVTTQSLRVYVTMDCDFLESEYFFSSQLDVEGEKTSEPPSWLGSLTYQETVPKKQIDGANEHFFVNVGGTSTTNEDPFENVQQEVSDLHSTELSPVMNEVTNNDKLAPELEPFTLLPRRNRGVPPDRYSPEHVPRNSRYPIKITRKGVTEIARAFLTSLLAEGIPKIVHEDSKKDEWQEATKIKNLVQHDRTKHVEVDRHFIKEKIKDIIRL